MAATLSGAPDIANRNPLRAHMTDIDQPDSDRLSRFLLQTAGVRGVRVHLRDAWQAVRANGPYPAAIDEMLGEACVASALFTGHAKVDGRLSVQLRAPGPLRTLFAECTAAGTIRGIARFDGDGSAYCHHCKTTHLEARAKASHARSSTMEKPDVAQQPETAASKPLP